jgi:hypothetical protein
MIQKHHVIAHDFAHQICNLNFFLRSITMPMNVTSPLDRAAASLGSLADNVGATIQAAKLSGASTTQPALDGSGIARGLGAVAAGIGEKLDKKDVAGLLSGKTREALDFAARDVLEGVGRIVSNSIQQNAPNLSNADFVALAYEKHLDRKPETNTDGTMGAGPQFWQSHLDNGTMTRAQVDEQIRTSPEGQSIAASRAETDATLQMMGGSTSSEPSPMPAPPMSPLLSAPGTANEIADKVKASLADVLAKVGGFVNAGGGVANQTIKFAANDLSKLASQIGAVVSSSTSGADRDQRLRFDRFPAAVLESVRQRNTRIDEPMPPFMSFNTGGVDARPPTPWKTVSPSVMPDVSGEAPIVNRSRPVMPSPQEIELASNLLVGRDFNSFGDDRASSLAAIKSLLSENGIAVGGLRDITASGPRSMITADFRPDRLNLDLSESGAISRAHFG